MQLIHGYQPQILPETWLEYKLPPIEIGTSEMGNNDWLQAQCRYARICARISETLSPIPGSSRQTRATLDLELELQNWYDLLPEGGRLVNGLNSSTLLNRQVAICVLYQHLEARLDLLDITENLASLSTTTQVSVWPSHSSTILSTAEEVFAASNKIEDAMYDR